MAQHKRKGATAKAARQERAQARQAKAQKWQFHAEQIRRLQREAQWVDPGTRHWKYLNDQIAEHRKQQFEAA